MSNLLNSYRNGNYTVSIYDNGTKIRETSDNKWLPNIPENADCKITNYCNNSAGCMAHCHERSNPSGVHGDLELGLNLFKSWTPGCELALGGGSTLSHPEIKDFLVELKKLGIISNITVNHFHIQTQHKLVDELVNKDLVKGIGVSYMPNLPIEYLDYSYNSNTIFHLIAGVHVPSDLSALYNKFKNQGKVKVLVLGYKEFGNGIQYHNKYNLLISDNIRKWYIALFELFKLENLVLSFDNLAIKQLNVRRFFRDEEWVEFYQGDDGFANMYIDLVKKEYAVSSRSPERFLLTMEDTVKTVFERVRIKT